MSHDRVPHDWLDRHAQWLLDGGNGVMRGVCVLIALIVLAAIAGNFDWPRP